MKTLNKQNARNVFLFAFCFMGNFLHIRFIVLFICVFHHVKYSTPAYLLSYVQTISSLKRVGQKRVLTKVIWIDFMQKLRLKLGSGDFHKEDFIDSKKWTLFEKILFNVKSFYPKLSLTSVIGSAPKKRTPLSLLCRASSEAVSWPTPSVTNTASSSIS